MEQALSRGYGMFARTTRGFSFNQSNGGHELRCELMIDIRFWTDFCTHHEIQTNLF